MIVTQRARFTCSYIYHNASKHATELCSSNYTVEVSVTRPGEDDKFVMEFSDLQKVLKSIVPDKKFLFGPFLSKKDEELMQVMKDLGVPTASYMFDVSAETLCEDIALQLSNELEFDYPGVQLLEVKLRENSDSFVVWHK